MILIDYLHARPGSGEAIRRADEPFISIVTWIEVMAGVADTASDQAARSVLSRFSTVNLEPDVADIAAAIRRERRLKLPDSIILATARHLRCPLVTRNTKDFGPASGEILVPYTR